MGDTYKVKTKGLNAYLDRLNSIRKKSRHLGVRVGARSTRGTVLKRPSKRSKLSENVQKVKPVRLKGGRSIKDVPSPKPENMIDQSELITKDVSRSAGLNVIVVRFHAKKGRKINFLSEEEFKKGNDLWFNGIADVTDRRVKKTDPLERKAEDIGKLISKSYANHIRRGKTAKGTMKDVKPGTKVLKEFQTGKKNLPPLIRTGQLMRSFTYTVKRYK